MTTGADHSGEEPEQPTPESIVHNAKMLGKAIRCTDPDGPLTDYLSVGDIRPLHWVYLSAEAQDAHVVHREEVIDAVRDAHPAVFVIDEERSLWGDTDA